MALSTDVPPLEDMSAMLEQVRNIRDSRDIQQNVSSNGEKPPDLTSERPEKTIAKVSFM